MSELSKYVQFNCVPQTYGTDRDAARLAKQIKADCELDDEEAGVADLFTMIYVCTASVTFSFDGTERQPLRDFKTKWDSLGKKPTAKTLWGVRVSMPHMLMAEWITAFNLGQDMYDVPPEQKPPNWLSDKEREEAQNDNSPLAEQTAVGKSA